MGKAQMKLIVGSPVSGESFFGRDREVKKLTGKILEGRNIYISAPRRIGKTSLMKHVFDQLISLGHTCFWIDVEGCTSPANFAGELFGVIYAQANKNKFEKLVHHFKKIGKNIGSGANSDITQIIKGIFGSASWQTETKTQLEELAGQNEGPIFIFIDELGILLQRLLSAGESGETEALDLLTWLREVCQKLSGTVCFIIASSVGIPSLLYRYNLSGHLNHFESFPLFPWDTSIAQAFIKLVFDSYGILFDDEAPAVMTGLLGECSPFFVQLYTDTLVDDAKLRLEDQPGFTVNGNFCREVFSSPQMHEKGKIQLNHLVERLRRSQSEEDVELAMQILSAVAKNKDGVSKSLINNSEKGKMNLVNMLVDDGYIKAEKDKYIFPSNYLREWWNARYG